MISVQSRLAGAGRQVGLPMSNVERTTINQMAILDPHIQGMEEQFSREKLLVRLQLVLNARQYLLRWVFVGLVVATSLELSLWPKKWK